MSEYMEKHYDARLIGAPPRAVGYEEGGYLSEAVRRKPYSVILLDEVDKAHPDVFNILLQVLDDGRLTDGHGRTVDFRNSVIVMTSNLGSDRIQELSASQDYDRMKSTVMEVVSGHFRPEFINRIDEVIVFKPLVKEQILAITKIQLQRLEQRLLQRDINIHVSEPAQEFLANAGFDSMYGARPLKRAIQQYLEDPLARDLLAGGFSAGETIQVDLEDGKLKFGK